MKFIRFALFYIFLFLACITFLLTRMALLGAMNAIGNGWEVQTIALCGAGIMTLVVLMFAWIALSQIEK